MGKLTDQEKLDVVDKYVNKGANVRSLAREYSLDRTSIRSILTRRGVKIINEPFLTEMKLKNWQKEEIIKKYATGEFTCKELGETYGVKRGTVEGLLKRRGIHVMNDKSELQRKYEINQDYFYIIDCPEKAYVLGLLYSDGCNYQDCDRISISLQERDKEILDKINVLMGSTKPLTFRKINKPNHQNQFCLTIQSRKMCEQLTELGCVPVKSLILKFPTENQVPRKFWKAFLIGMIDGDGCIFIGKDGIRKGTKPAVQITSTLDFCLGFQKYMEEELDIRPSISKAFKGKNPVTRSAIIGGNRQMYKFLNWLYDGATIFMKRKHDKFLEFKKFLMNRPQVKHGQFLSIKEMADIEVKLE